MNTECMYILKEQTMDAAKKFAEYLSDLAEKKGAELTPTYISVAKKDFRVTPDYDGYQSSFKVKAGTIFVWADGKLHWMYDLRPRGARRCFPYATCYDINPDDIIDDVIEL